MTITLDDGGDQAVITGGNGYHSIGNDGIVQSVIRRTDPRRDEHCWPDIVYPFQAWWWQPPAPDDCCYPSGRWRGRWLPGQPWCVPPINSGDPIDVVSIRHYQPVVAWWWWAYIPRARWLLWPTFLTGILMRANDWAFPCYWEWWRRTLFWYIPTYDTLTTWWWFGDTDWWHLVAGFVPIATIPGGDAPETDSGTVEGDSGSGTYIYRAPLTFVPIDDKRRRWTLLTWEHDWAWPGGPWVAFPREPLNDYPVTGVFWYCWSSPTLS